MRVRQSMLKTWMKCPLILKYEQIDGLQREQSASLTFGSIIHHCVQQLEETQDLERAIKLFQELWIQPTLLDPTYQPTYYVKGTSWKKFMEKGERILRDWWGIVSWDSAHTIAREHFFEVPIGDGHILTGTADKIELAFRADLNGGLGGWVIKVVDYKTDNKTPTYGYLEEDLQFSSYAYASLQREFWTGIGGDEAWEKYKDLPRYGEWVQLTGPKRMDAGIREERHYNRLIMAVDALAESVAMRIFVPNISGETCRYCDYRKVCGLPELTEDGELPTTGP